MAVISAILGAFFTGVVWWIIYGNGVEFFNHWLDEREEKQQAENNKAQNSKAQIEQRESPQPTLLDVMKDVREAALVMLVQLAALRGELTSEQKELLAELAKNRLNLTKAENALSLATFAVEEAKNPDVVFRAFQPVFGRDLSSQERDDLLQMLEDVANLHGGATKKQELWLKRLREFANFA